MHQGEGERYMCVHYYSKEDQVLPDAVERIEQALIKLGAQKRVLTHGKS